jgi:hypothetical protein
MAKFAELRHLESFNFSLGVSKKNLWVDWCEPLTLSSFQPNGLSSLVAINLQTVKMSAESMMVIGAAVPNVKRFGLHAAVLTCHPAVMCAIIGGLCADITHLTVNDECCHTWRNVEAEDMAASHRRALQAADRSPGYATFTQLSQLSVMMCWCTSPAAWHATMALFKSATKLKTVTSLASHDPLIIVSLAYLPFLSALGAESADCLWANSFAMFMKRKSKRTVKSRYLAAKDVSGYARSGCPRDGSSFKLSQFTKDGEMGACVQVRPRSAIFPNYERTLSVEHQAVLS